MDTDLAKLSVQLELQTAAFERGVKQMDSQLKKMDDNTKRSAKGIEKLNTSVVKLGKGFAALAGVASVGALAQQTKEALEFADAIAKTADKVGVTTNELQELRFAASQSGIETRTLDMALQRFARRMGEAAQGTGELLKTTQELGIEFQDETGRYYSTTELLVQYADAMGKAETQQEKLRLAFKAFDSEGAALVNLLGEGSEELQAFREQAVEMGLVIDGQLVRQAEIITDKFDILATQLKVGVTSAFINATAAALEFFGVFTDLGRAEAALAIASQEVEKLEQQIADAGTVSQKNRLKRQLRQRKIEQRELQEQVDSLTASEKELTDAVNAGTNAFTRRAEEYNKQLYPLLGLQEEIENIQSAVGNGLTQADAWKLIAAAVEEYNQKVLKAAEKTGDVKESFDDLISGINASLNKAETALPDDWLADIGVGFGSVKKEADESLDQILQAVNGFSRDFTNTLVDGLKTGEFAFDDFAKNVLETIAKMLLNDIFTQFFEIIYGGIKSYFNIGTTSTGSGDTRLGTLGRVAMPTDGMTRAGETSTAMVGTVVARASPKGTSSTGQVTVNVNNYGNDEVSIAERRDSNGGIDIDVLIKQKVNSGFARGDYDKMLGSAFGLRRLGY